MMRMSAVRLRHLRTFVTVARQGHVGRAAADLSVTQPAVSKSIRDLKQILGVELFDRTRRGAVLSASAEVLLRELRAAAAEIRSG